jgi:hypothetical protein
MRHRTFPPGRKGELHMSISGLSALSITPAPLDTTSASSSSQQDATKTLTQLLKDIESGNISDAQKDLATLNQQLGSSQSGNSNSPLSTLLTALGKDLGSGNISGAQSDVQNFFNSLEGSGQAGSGATGQASGSSASPAASTDAAGGSSSTSGIDGSIKSDFLALLQNVQSGNLQGAQSAYQKLTSLLSQNGSATSGSATSNTQNASSSSSTQQDPLQKLLNALGGSLSSGNLAVAQQELQAFFQSSGQGSGVFVATNA